MWHFGLENRSTRNGSSSQKIVAEYRRLRKVCEELNMKITGHLSGEALHEGARKLGILRDEALVFDEEYEFFVLMDYCIYDVYCNGRNAVDQYLCDQPPDPESVEMSCLRAMERATYALVSIVSVEPGVGCLVRNLVTGEERLLVDISLSQTAPINGIFATRLLDFGEYLISTGAGLPLAVLDGEALDRWQQKLRAGLEVGDPATLIRACLERAASFHIRCAQAGSPLIPRRKGSPEGKISSQQRRERTRQLSSRNARNKRCPCGSGKMHRNCCGKHAVHPAG